MCPWHKGQGVSEANRAVANGGAFLCQVIARAVQGYGCRVDEKRTVPDARCRSLHGEEPKRKEKEANAVKKVKKQRKKVRKRKASKKTKKKAGFCIRYTWTLAQRET